MNSKRTQLIHAGLELFASDGYHAVATSRIAKEAGVSEGLIFRHFGNKAGLLDAILGTIDNKINHVFAPILFEGSPSKAIMRVLEMPFLINESEKTIWFLYQKMKWEDKYYQPDKMQPLLDRLIWAFTALEYAEPQNEARFILQVIDTLIVARLRDEIPEGYIEFLWGKYDLQ